MPIARGLVVAVVAALVVVSCDSGSSPPHATRTTRPVVQPGPDGTVEVVVQDNVFTPQHLRVRAGTRVRWRNQGFSPHRLTSSDQGQDFHGAAGTPFGVVPDRFRERDTYEFTFTKPGTYAYYCSIHGLPHQGMFGSVEVTAK